ncbi:OB-fold protein [Flavivirga algicola]|uniref:tRNA_anti-like n=1 Tax=Flavivirga algicola TaxID=2729136 RepID=A0ABX1RSY4_9FLAO|nr:hypothetical protein [Flavivirga algicola]NMH86656.1 hypothetical protein [Flavivirga algicola]
MGKNRKTRISIIALIIVVLIVIIGYNYIYQDHRNIEKEKATFSLSADEISAEFSKDPDTAEKKYLNKTVEIYGTITELNPMDMTLNNNVYGAFNISLTATTSYHINSKIKIKGRCIGYDDLLEQVKLDQCTISD